jgi:hypothetical protein
LQKFDAINSMLATGVVDRLKSCDRAADTSHSEIQKGADGCWPVAHHSVDEHVWLDGGRLLGHLVNVIGPLKGSLRGRKERNAPRN